MAPQHHFATEILQSVSQAEDVFDDTLQNTPVRTATVPEELRTRFIRRLAKLTAATVTMQEERSGTSVAIIMSRNPGSPQPRIELDGELNEFLGDLKRLMELISRHPNGNAFQQAKEDSVDLILMFSYCNVDHIVESLQRVFRDNETEYDELVTRLLGINANIGTKVDVELGDAIIKLQQLTKSYDKSPRQLQILIQEASSMTKHITHLSDRLRFLLMRPNFSNELYRLICTLGSPERAYQTFMRTAQTSRSFQRVTITTRPNPPSPSRVRFSLSPPRHNTKATSSPPRSALRKPSTNAGSTACAAAATLRAALPANASHMPAPAPSPKRQSQQQLIDLDQDVPPPSPSSNSSVSYYPSTEAITSPQEVLEIPSTRQQHSHASSSQETDIYAVVRPYLTEDDQDVGIVRLQPQVKQEAVRLAAAVLRRNLVSVTAEAWYTFGFVTVKNIEEERYLAGLYATILKEAVDKVWIFQEIMRAIDKHQLPQLFDRAGYSHFRQEFPLLEPFLRTAPKNRPTVWQLKQFLYDEKNTVPPLILQRDYGFKYCLPREEVTRLKNIYAAVLKNAEIMDLHAACVNGRLVEFAAQKGVIVDSEDRRLMLNDHPAQYIGFDNGLGLPAHRGRFFKRGQ